jgi:hypothetical protein
MNVDVTHKEVPHDPQLRSLRRGFEQAKMQREDVVAAVEGFPYANLRVDSDRAGQIEQYCTILYNIVQYCTILYNIVSNIL